MIILAIDPGTIQSAWLAFDTTMGRPFVSPDPFPVLRWIPRGIEANGELLQRLREWHDAARVGGITGVPYLGALVIEQVVSYGMPIGRETIETVHWAGRFAEAVWPLPVYRIPRLTVRMALCHSTRATDATVRRALLDRFGGDSAKGTKRNPGPLYQIHADLWSALALACTWADMEPDQRAEARLP